MIEQINNFNDKTSEKVQSKLKLALLERMVKRLDKYKEECAECQDYHENMDKILSTIASYIENPSKEKLKNYEKEKEDIIKHFKQDHELVEEGYYLQIGISIGISFGLLFGTLMDTIPIGMLFGISIGTGIGSHLDSVAKKEGKII